MERRDRFKLVGLSGVSGAAGPCAAAACGLSWGWVQRIMGQINAQDIYSPNLWGLAKALPRKLKGFTGVFRGKPFRDKLHDIIGDLKFSDTKVPLEIPAFDVEEAQVTLFSTALSGDVALVPTCRASGAIFGVFEAESGFTKNGHHYVDPGWSTPIWPDIVKRVDHDLVIVLVNDLGKPGRFENLRTENWAIAKLLWQVGYGDYTRNLQEGCDTILEVSRRANRQALIWTTPYEVNLLSFTGEQLLGLANASASSLGASLDSLPPFAP